MFQICYAVGGNAETAERLWWDMPLSKLWVSLHCYMVGQGAKVAYSSSMVKIKEQARRLKNVNLESKKPAYESNLADIDWHK